MKEELILFSWHDSLASFTFYKELEQLLHCLGVQCEGMQAWTCQSGSGEDRTTLRGGLQGRGWWQ